MDDKFGYNPDFNSRVITTPEKFDEMIEKLIELKEMYFERLTFYDNKFKNINEDKKDSHLDAYEKNAVAKRMFFMEDVLKRKVCEVNQAVWELNKRIKSDII